MFRRTCRKVSISRAKSIPLYIVSVQLSMLGNRKCFGEHDVKLVYQGQRSILLEMCQFRFSMVGKQSQGLPSQGGEGPFRKPGEGFLFVTKQHTCNRNFSFIFFFNSISFVLQGIVATCYKNKSVRCFRCFGICLQFGKTRHYS